MIFIYHRLQDLSTSNYGPEDVKDPKAVSQGTRLSLDIYRVICEWAELGWPSKSLKVSQKNAPPLGLYLRFSKDVEFGRVRLGPEELDTRFDILPGLSNSGHLDTKSMQYFFLFKEPSYWQDEESDESENEDGTTIGQATKGVNPSSTPVPLFVRWKADSRRHQVSLSPMFYDDCLVQLWTKLKAYEIIRDYGEDMWKLRMQMKAIVMPERAEEREGLFNLFESSEVDFIKTKEKTSLFPVNYFRAILSGGM